MEKRGVIDENTPQDTGPGRVKEASEPTSKEAADRLESHLLIDAADLVAEQTRQRRDHG